MGASPNQEGPMFQVSRKNRFSGETFVLGTYATIQEANRQRALANARRADANYKVVQVA
jgi:hypothetical protein